MIRARSQAVHQIYKKSPTQRIPKDAFKLLGATNSYQVHQVSKQYNFNYNQSREFCSKNRGFSKAFNKIFDDTFSGSGTFHSESIHIRTTRKPKKRVSKNSKKSSPNTSIHYILRIGNERAILFLPRDSYAKEIFYDRGFYSGDSNEFEGVLTSNDSIQVKNFLSELMINGAFVEIYNDDYAKDYTLDPKYGFRKRTIVSENGITNTDILIDIESLLASFSSAKSSPENHSENIETVESDSSVSDEYKQLPQDFQLHQFVEELKELKLFMGNRDFGNMPSDEFLDAYRNFLVKYQDDITFEPAKFINYENLYNNLKYLFKLNGDHTFILDTVINSESVFSNVEKQIQSRDGSDLQFFGFYVANKSILDRFVSYIGLQNHEKPDLSNKSLIVYIKRFAVEHKLSDHDFISFRCISDHFKSFEKMPDKFHIQESLTELYENSVYNYDEAEYRDRVCANDTFSAFDKKLQAMGPGVGKEAHLDMYLDRVVELNHPDIEEHLKCAMLVYLKKNYKRLLHLPYFSIQSFFEIFSKDEILSDYYLSEYFQYYHIARYLSSPYSGYFHPTEMESGWDMPVLFDSKSLEVYRNLSARLMSQKFESSFNLDVLKFKAHNFVEDTSSIYSGVSMSIETNLKDFKEFVDAQYYPYKKFDELTNEELRNSFAIYESVSDSSLTESGTSFNRWLTSALYNSHFHVASEINSVIRKYSNENRNNIDKEDELAIKIGFGDFSPKELCLHEFDEALLIVRNYMVGKTGRFCQLESMEDFNIKLDELREIFIANDSNIHGYFQSCFNLMDGIVRLNGSFFPLDYFLEKQCFEMKTDEIYHGGSESTLDSDVRQPLIVAYLLKSFPTALDNIGHHILTKYSSDEVLSMDTKSLVTEMRDYCDLYQGTSNSQYVLDCIPIVSLLNTDDNEYKIIINHLVSNCQPSKGADGVKSNPYHELPDHLESLYDYSGELQEFMEFVQRDSGSSFNSFKEMGSADEVLRWLDEFIQLRVGHFEGTTSSIDLNERMEKMAYAISRLFNVHGAAPESLDLILQNKHVFDSVSKRIEEQRHKTEFNDAGEVRESLPVPTSDIIDPAYQDTELESLRAREDAADAEASQIASTKATDGGECIQDAPGKDTRMDYDESFEKISNINIEEDSECRLNESAKFTNKQAEILKTLSSSEFNKIISPSKLKKVERLISLLKTELTSHDNRPTYGRRIVEEEIKQEEASLNEMSPKDVREAYKKMSAGKSNKDTTHSDDDKSSHHDKISLNDFETYLREKNSSYEQDKESSFREKKAYEWSSSMTKPSPRTLEYKNFFNPKDYSQKKPKIGYTGLLFPETVSSTHKEFLLVTMNGKSVVSKENPLGKNFVSQDMFTIFSRIHERPETILDLMNKFQKKDWKLIGGGGPNKLLVFERPAKAEKRVYGKVKTAFAGIGVLVSGLIGFNLLSEPDSHRRGEDSHVHTVTFEHNQPPGKMKYYNHKEAVVQENKSVFTSIANLFWKNP